MGKAENESIRVIWFRIELFYSIERTSNVLQGTLASNFAALDCSFLQQILYLRALHWGGGEFELHEEENALSSLYYKPLHRCSNFHYEQYREKTFTQKYITNQWLSSERSCTSTFTDKLLIRMPLCMYRLLSLSLVELFYNWREFHTFLRIEMHIWNSDWNKMKSCCYVLKYLKNYKK